MVTAELKIKYKGRSIEWLEDKLQDLVNAKVRRRDSVNGFFICISCDELKSINQMNAGHYYPKEPRQYRSVKFDLDNIHGQCVRCNKYLSANLIPYRANLLLKIGEQRLIQLEQKAALNGFRYSREFLIEQIEKLKYEKH
ncbi:NinG protein [Chryseobacterium carnipullorum]|uniref:NinG protein n=1 Tax=Chryseobacterium carnipullorum TaxID=1124835 RepID=A0A376DTY4_CHRCU|nr:recombination protein NinG [Chryseobacterium carnipullorum]AZA49724.1 NinG protein [Chryseobacterium carnipullorum]AZA64614.1 NinG protein [Chryseobacterium carnipullorum]STC95432.1 Bacteriophage Lambda NinG protein [Chryseobacterium carnipullorum]